MQGSSVGRILENIGSLHLVFLSHVPEPEEMTIESLATQYFIGVHFVLCESSNHSFQFLVRLLGRVLKEFKVHMLCFINICNKLWYAYRYTKIKFRIKKSYRTLKIKFSSCFRMYLYHRFTWITYKMNSMIYILKQLIYFYFNILYLFFILNLISIYV